MASSLRPPQSKPRRLDRSSPYSMLSNSAKRSSRQTHNRIRLVIALVGLVLAGLVYWTPLDSWLSGK
ncbi:hypothetical protein O0I10_003647, partial [Lichtheimia ornata]